MKKFSVNLITNSIIKVIGKGPHSLHEPVLGKKEIEYVSKSIKSNFVSTKGKFVEKFENEIKKFTKSNFVVSTINCTQALFLSLKVLGVKKDDEVLVPALTFVGTVNAISYLGAEPHFIDSTISNLGVDSKKLEIYLMKHTKIKNNKCINKKTGKVIKAIIPVHVFGHACDIEKIVKIARKYKFEVIEDAAECLGSFFKRKHLGTFGKIGCLSFNGNKIITTGGGGAILINNKKIYKKIKHLATTAKLKHSWEYDHDQIGFNFRMPSINAALGFAQLRQIKKFIKSKRNLFLRYQKSFEKVEGVKIFKDNKFEKSNYWLQTLILNTRFKKYKNKILKENFKKKIYLRPAWKLISNLKPYQRKQKMSLSGAKEIYDKVINLPSSQYL